MRARTVPLAKMPTRRLARQPKSAYITRRSFERTVRSTYKRGYWDGIKTVLMLVIAALAMLFVGMVEGGMMFPWE